MKSILLSVSLFLVAGTAFGQTTVSSLESAKDQDINVMEIEKNYGDALNADPSLAVFKGKESEFYQSYLRLIQDLGAHLHNNGFTFDEDTRTFTRIYFSADGTIDHFYYSSRQAGFDADREKQFNEIVKPFLSSYKFGEQASESFAQCSPIVYSETK